MSANTPGWYLGQGGRRMSRKPDFNLLSGVPMWYDAMREEEFRRALQPGPELPPEAITQIPGPGEYPIPSMGAQHDGRVIRQIGQRGIGAEPVAPVAGTDKSVEYPPGQSLMPSAVAPTSKTVEYPMPAPPTSSWDRPERRVQPLPKDWRPEPKVQPLPKSWKEGDPLPQGTFSQPGYTPEQQAQIEWAQTSPGPEEIVYPVQDRLRDSQRRSDVAWGASNLVLDKGAQLAADDPSIAGAIRGKAAEYAMSHGMDAQRANNEWEKDRTRLDAIATDPNGAAMYERYKQGQIPGYQITSNPNVSPYWKKLVAEEPIGRNPARYGNIVREGSSSRRGMSADYLEGEAGRQIGGVIDRMARGVGNKMMREATNAYARAIRETSMYEPGTPEHTKALKAEKEAALKAQRAMNPLMSKFESRMGSEGNDQVKGAAWAMADAAIRERVQGALGRQAPSGQEIVSGPYRPSQNQPGSTRTQPARRGQQPEMPVTPVVRKTLSNQTVEKLASPEVYFATVMGGKYTPPPGGAIQVGNDVFLPGLSYKPDGSTTPTLRPAITVGDYYVSDPRSFAGDTPAKRKAEWASQLTDDERNDLFRAFVVEGGDRALPDQIRKRLREVYRSRLGVNSSPLSDKDMKDAMSKLKSDEDDALYAALVGFPGSRQPRFQGEIEAPHDMGASGSGRSGRTPRGGTLPAPKFDVEVEKRNGELVIEEQSMPNLESVWKVMSPEQQQQFNVLLNALRRRNSGAFPVTMDGDSPTAWLAGWDSRFGEMLFDPEFIQSSDLVDRIFDEILDVMPIIDESGNKFYSVGEMRGGPRPQQQPQPQPQPRQAGNSQTTQALPIGEQTAGMISRAAKDRRPEASEQMSRAGADLFMQAFPTAEAFDNATPEELEAVFAQIEKLEG